jgi:hypothetical protein
MIAITAALWRKNRPDALTDCEHLDKVPDGPSIERHDQFLRLGQESFDPSALNSKLPLSDKTAAHGMRTSTPRWG